MKSFPWKWNDEIVYCLCHIKFPFVKETIRINLEMELNFSIHENISSVFLFKLKNEKSQENPFKVHSFSRALVFSLGIINRALNKVL